MSLNRQSRSHLGSLPGTSGRQKVLRASVSRSRLRSGGKGGDCHRVRRES